MTQSPYQKLYARGLKLLSHRSYSEGELADKLSRYGDPDTVAQVLADFKAINLVNDIDFARNFASYRVRSKRFGRTRAAQDLRKRKVSGPVIEQALDAVYQEVGEDTLIDQAADKWIQRAGTPKDMKALRRLIGFLQRQGFSSERVYAKLSVYFSELKAQGPTEKSAE